MAFEVTGLRCRVESQQPRFSEDEAREVEQAVLNRFSKNKLASNAEILGGVDPVLVLSAIELVIRDLSNA